MIHMIINIRHSIQGNRAALKDEDHIWDCVRVFPVSLCLFHNVHPFDNCIPQMLQQQLQKTDSKQVLFAPTRSER